MSVGRHPPLLLLTAVLSLSLSQGDVQLGRRMMQLGSQTSELLPLVSLGGSLCTQGRNIAGSMRVQCVSLSGKTTHIACVRMCQATQESCAPCDDINETCRRAANVYNANVFYSANTLGAYQDPGCQIWGGGPTPRLALAPAPSQQNATSSGVTSALKGGQPNNVTP